MNVRFVACEADDRELIIVYMLLSCSVSPLVAGVPRNEGPRSQTEPKCFIGETDAYVSELLGNVSGVPGKQNAGQSQLPDGSSESCAQDPQATQRRRSPSSNEQNVTKRSNAASNPTYHRLAQGHRPTT